MCFDTELSEMSKGSATSVTRASPAASCRRILRRVSSARPISVSSSCMAAYSPIWVNMSSARRRAHFAQPVDAAQARKKLRPERHDDEGADAAGERRRHGAEKRGEQPRAEFAELVGAADEEHVDRAYPSAHVLRRRELHDSRTHENAHRIRRPHD